MLCLLMENVEIETLVQKCFTDWQFSSLHYASATNDGKTLIEKRLAIFFDVLNTFELLVGLTF